MTVDDLYYDKAHSQSRLAKYHPANTSHDETSSCGSIAEWWLMCNSYGYLGWLLDRCGAQYSSEEATSLLGSIASLKGITIPPGTAVPGQFANALIALFNKGTFTNSPDTYSAGFKVMDDDLSVSSEGNGGGQSIYRLREGIERFLITDINNPAAGAKAQSEIAIMFDSIDSTGTNFNHIPGGCNVLYMDGHVTFVRYEQNGDFPVNGTVALLIGLIS